MKKTVIALLGFVFASAALADTNLNSAGAISGSTSTSNSGANSAALQGNDQSVNISSPGTVTYDGKYTVRSVPGVNMGNVFPTSPCMGSSQVGGAGVGFGLSFGTSWEDKDCSIRETSRSFASMGMLNDAVKVLCSSTHAAVAPSCVGVNPLPANKPSTPVADCYRDEVVAKRVGKPICM